jgi:glycosyltransferase involved in cell wall biosynthesis
VTVVANELRGFVPVGGMGTATTFLALALARMGHSVEILLGRHGADSINSYWGTTYTRAGIRIRSAPPSEERVEPPNFAVAGNVAAALRADAPEVVIAHDFGAPAYAALRLRQAGIALENTLFVTFCHGARLWIMDLSRKIGVTDLRQLLAFSILERAAVELADVVVSPSAHLVRWMREQGWRLPERTIVIPYFTRSAATGEPARTRGRGDDGGPVQRLAFFGRLDEKKGLRPFAAALNTLEPQLLDGLEVEFIGKPTATWTRERVEGLLTEPTKRVLASVSFETQLDQHEALTRLSRAGTLAVMPSLGENSPNVVYECLEHGIPFIASNVGGVPELVAPEDRARVLFEPTHEGVAGALRRLLSEKHALRPVRPGFDVDESHDRWAEVIDMRPPPRTRTADEPVDVVIVHCRSSEALARCLAAVERQTYADFRVIVVAAGRTSAEVAVPEWLAGREVVVRSEQASFEAARRAALHVGSAPYVVFLDEEDVPDEELLQALVRARAASGADAVSCAVRVADNRGEHAVHVFAGEPGGLGALANAYGNVALIRRSLLGELTGPWPAEGDGDWPLLAGLTVSGADVVSIPLPLVNRGIRPGTVESDPTDALLVVERLERVLPTALRSLARLAAGLAADAGAPELERSGGMARRGGAFKRLLQSVRGGFI